MLGKPEPVIVQVEINSENEKAQALAERLSLPLIEASSPWLANSIRLRYQDAVLYALSVDPAGAEMAVKADFQQVLSTRRRQQAQGELLIKAVQGRQRQPLFILDATAGMAADSMVMAAMGHQVLALEQSSVVYEVVQDGLQRAAHAGISLLPDLHQAEAVAWLTINAEQMFDVIYLDPMFAESSKRALPRKNMQLLRRLTEAQTGSETLWSLAKTRARLRVVVKRPLKGGPLAGSPDYSIKGQRIRFDIYQSN